MARRHWAVVPAAGVGRRMGGAVPKQYLNLHGRPVIDHTLRTLVAHPRIARVIVAVSATDAWWSGTAYAEHPRIQRVAGGRERADSVLNGLLALQGEADAMDWVLVHDAARPCLHRSDLDRLLQALAGHPVGGLLAIPFSDTIKRADPAGRVLETVPREQLWRAFTPQMFRYAALREALERAREDGLLVTDESSAMERSGAAPLLIAGRSDNIKITSPEDLVLAGFFLERQGGG
ncbi:2-C-methyl-D-erythritol 4-phosphate cytidylyltransferase [Sedimenticola hydrogenitrophicus]|uniref:2-C-methyl-D-erythritol 4-phosphate cytidylyltransferase n=1 Tax=Sedimenticola hydrogenitrophicus TaxID=2967975 RepID=UPI0023B18C54|nr:2-C-methyl-D-erythritol 4-phosphate cytidylyltransferase [Sedimenticola hydrogenitrophicus]